MKKLCIFDFDGTLFDSLTDVAKCFNQTFEELNFKTHDLDFYKHSVGGNIDEIVSKVLQNKNTPENIRLVKDRYTKLYKNDLKENTKLYNGIYKLLKQLQNDNFILAINSNRDSESIRHFVNKFASDIKFIDIQGHTATNPSKPDPYGVNRIIQKANVKKEETLYIGDSATDIQTAKNANINCLLVTWGYGVNDVYKDKYPIAITNNTNELLKIIKNS